ncbi:MAG: hypothetical protein FGM57_00960 [Candidatus Taylorbacteria bacterium]|nr:hypothetical protein [Candidatus Taylorbacteria bacterium]
MKRTRPEPQAAQSWIDDFLLSIGYPYRMIAELLMEKKKPSEIATAMNRTVEAVYRMINFIRRELCQFLDSLKPAHV